MKQFGAVVIQATDNNFCSFAHVTDDSGKTWELRGYGETIGEAADQAWNRFMEDEKRWTNYGFVTGQDLRPCSFAF